MLSNRKELTIITHNGIFHADEVFAIALLLMVLSQYKIKIIRTRDPEIIKTGDIVVDVGYIYNEENDRFDHHMRDFSLCRDENSIKYSSFGLVFNKYGLEFCDNDETMFNMFDHILVQPIDAIDNGQKFIDRLINIDPYTVSNIISDFNPTWFDQPQEYDECFNDAVEFASKIISNVYRKCKSKTMSQSKVEEIYNNSENKKIIIMDKYIPWQDVLIQYDEPLFVIFPDPSNNEWRVQCVPVSNGSFTTRVSLKEEWQGLELSELKEISKIDDIVFVHRNGFIGGAKSKKSCILMAMESIQC